LRGNSGSTFPATKEVHDCGKKRQEEKGDDDGSKRGKKTAWTIKKVMKKKKKKVGNASLSGGRGGSSAGANFVWGALPQGKRRKKKGRGRQRRKPAARNGRKASETGSGEEPGRDVTGQPAGQMGFQGDQKRRPC